MWLNANGLKIRCHDYLGLKNGDNVLAFIRPENIRVIPNGSTDKVVSNQYLNEVEGEIIKIVFEGSTVHFDARVGETVLRVELAGTERLTVLNQQGASVRLGFDQVTLIKQ